HPGSGGSPYAVPLPTTRWPDGSWLASFLPAVMPAPTGEIKVGGHQRLRSIRSRPSVAGPFRRATTVIASPARQAGLTRQLAAENRKKRPEKKGKKRKKRCNSFHIISYI